MAVRFDDYATDYKDHVDRAISFSGKDIDFFTQAKARHLLRLVRSSLGDPSGLTALDVGCGTGLTDKYLATEFEALHGVDTAAASVAEAAATNPDVDYKTYDGGTLPYDNASFDVTFTINVLHHVPPSAWEGFVAEMKRVTRVGGMVAIFEQNPLNPLTRLAVDRCPFDADAVLLPKKRAISLLEGSGLSLCEHRFILFFPWENPIFEGLERALRRIPLGAQYYVAGRKTTA